MRAAPQLKPASVARKERTDDDRSYRFLTYVFGGGVRVRDHEKHGDTVTPVRVPSVRGQLRFWWRACNPSGCETLEKLRKREGEIWGTTSQASPVEVTVLKQLGKPRNVSVYEYNDRNRLVPCRGMREIAYGAFPLQPSREDQQQGAQPWVLFDYGSSPFTLRFTYPKECSADVEAALWAWETFGGLGGRTRRGFGAICRVSTPSNGSIESQLAKYRENPRIPGVPSLNGSRFRVETQRRDTVLEAWTRGLGLLQRIRQGRGFGRNDPPPNSQKPAGRSRWPEPDEIRRLTGKTAPIHQRPTVQVQRFPRAAFGMPIVFHFHPGSRNEPGSEGDPGMKPLELRPVSFERFASPLIIRPIPDDNGFRASALVLSSDVPPAELVAGNRTFPVKTTLDPNLARQIPVLNRGGQIFIDPIQLYLTELET